MPEGLWTVIGQVLVLIVLFILYLILPRLTREEIIFGVRIPDQHRDNSELKALYRQYTKRYLLICLPLFLILSILVFMLPENPWLVLTCILICTVASSFEYYRCHKTALRIKKEKGWSISKSEVVVIDTELIGHKKAKTLVSPLWFLLPIGVMVLNGVLLYRYNQLAGEMTKQLLSQAVIIMVLFFAYKTIGYARQQVKASEPEKSIYQSRKFRQIWSGFIVVIALVSAVTYTVPNLTRLGIIRISPDAAGLTGLVIAVVIVGATIVLSLRTGQGGSRIKMSGQHKANAASVDRNDDKYWKWGMFYFNPNDPSIFVEKRYGIGMTVNFGRIEGILVLVGIIAGIVLLTVFN